MHLIVVVFTYHGWSLFHSLRLLIWTIDDPKNAGQRRSGRRSVSTNHLHCHHRQKAVRAVSVASKCKRRRRGRRRRVETKRMIQRKCHRLKLPYQQPRLPWLTINSCIECSSNSCRQTQQTIQQAIIHRHSDRDRSLWSQLAAGSPSHRFLLWHSKHNNNNNRLRNRSTTTMPWQWQHNDLRKKNNNWLKSDQHHGRLVVTETTVR